MGIFGGVGNIGMVACSDASLISSSVAKNSLYLGSSAWHPSGSHLSESESIPGTAGGESDMPAPKAIHRKRKMVRTAK